MINLKVNGIVAGIAFILSFIVGLISRISIPMLIIRALLFSVIFFAISLLIKILVSHFLPELLEEDEMESHTAPQPGSRVNITEGDDYYPSQQVQRPAVVGAQPDDSHSELGNISDLLNKSGISDADKGQTGMDQNQQDRYTKDEGLGLFSVSSLVSPIDSALTFKDGISQAAPAKKAPVSGEIGNTSDSSESLPDLESMAGVFGPVSGHADSGSAEHSAPNPGQKPSLKNKAPEWSGDFHAKDLAEGLRTILIKEKEG